MKLYWFSITNIYETKTESTNQKSTKKNGESNGLEESAIDRGDEKEKG